MEDWFQWKQLESRSVYSSSSFFERALLNTVLEISSVVCGKYSWKNVGGIMYRPPLGCFLWNYICIVLKIPPALIIHSFW